MIAALFTHFSSARNLRLPQLIGHLIRWGFIAAFAMMTTACGGGAGTVGIASKTALYTSAPSAITIPINSSSAVSYTIGGGTAPYKATSSNTAVITAEAKGPSLNLIGLTAGAAQISVTDATGASFSIAATVGTGGTSTALYSTAPTSVTVAVGATSAFIIGGGTPNYLVSSSNTAVATVAINGNAFIVSGITVGSAQIALFDSTGTSITIGVTVGSGGPASALYVTAPSAVAIAVSANNTYTIGGGTAPYVATSSNTAVATASITGSTLKINGVEKGSAQILVFDATGTSVTITLTIGTSATNNSTALYIAAPSAVSIAAGANATYTIGGGTAPYTATSSYVGVATASVSGTTLTIRGIASGAAQVLVFDAAGASVPISVSIAQNNNTAIDVQPNGASGNVGEVLQFLVSGGTAPYKFSVSNPSVATITPSTVTTSGGSFSANLLNAGTAIATIVDASGQTKAITITAALASTSLRLSPSTVLIAEDSTANIALNIFGGTGPYRAFTSDQTLSSVSTAGPALTIGLGTNLNRCINPIDSSGVRVPNGIFDVTITVVDNLGASATAIMSIKDNGVGTGSVATQPAPFVAPCG